MFINIPESVDTINQIDFTFRRRKATFNRAIQAFRFSASRERIALILSSILLFKSIDFYEIWFGFSENNFPSSIPSVHQHDRFAFEAQQLSAIVA